MSVSFSIYGSPGGALPPCTQRGCLHRRRRCTCCAHFRRQMEHLVFRGIIHASVAPRAYFLVFDSFCSVFVAHFVALAGGLPPVPSSLLVAAAYSEQPHSHAGTAW